MHTSLSSKTVLALALLVLLAGCGSNPHPEVAALKDPVPQRAPHLPHRTMSVEDRGGGNLSPFNTRDAEIGNLDPDLLKAVQAAARQANDDGVAFWVTSGWRSRAHQQRLLNEAVAKYGSLSEALRWVSTPDTSAHVRGDAVDIGPTEADSWLSQYGARWGLCRMFANEVWHFERATAPGGTCPDLFPDSSYRQ